LVHLPLRLNADECELTSCSFWTRMGHLSGVTQSVTSTKGSHFMWNEWEGRSCLSIDVRVEGSDDPDT
jgi:hypothetical protein